MPTTVTLRNKTKRLLTLNLPHALVPERATMAVVGTRHHTAQGARRVTGPKDPSAPAAGERALTARRGPVSGSVTMLAKGDVGGGDYARDLPRSVLTAPDVVDALRRGDVEVVEAPAAEAASAPDEKQLKPADKKLAAKVVE